MNILAMDCACEALSVALAAGNDNYYMEIDTVSRHSELLLECADLLCKTAGIKPHEINLAACMKGPGSFTGLRIAYSAAKGLAAALGIPLAAIPTLDCIARPLSMWPGLVLPAIDAKAGCFFFSFYRDGKLLTDYMDAKPEVIAEMIMRLRLSPSEPLVITGPGAELLFSSLKPHLLPGMTRADAGAGKGTARELLEIAKSTIISEVGDCDSGPLYLRPSDAEKNRPKDR